MRPHRPGEHGTCRSRRGARGCAGGMRDRRRCASCRRGRPRDTGLNSAMLSNGNGALNWNSKLSGRQDTCGTTRDAVGLHRRGALEDVAWPSGPSMPPSSAVQLIGLPVRRLMSANSSRKRPGPSVACMTPCGDLAERVGERLDLLQRRRRGSAPAGRRSRRGSATTTWRNRSRRRAAPRATMRAHARDLVGGRRRVRSPPRP